MPHFFEDITTDGELRAAKLFGELSDQTRAPLDSAIQAVSLEQQATNAALCSAQDIIRELTDNYNKAIEVINNLSERVAALESNYDPTVIGDIPSAIKNKE